MKKSKKRDRAEEEALDVGAELAAVIAQRRNVGEPAQRDRPRFVNFSESETFANPSALIPGYNTRVYENTVATRLALLARHPRSISENDVQSEPVVPGNDHPWTYPQQLPVFHDEYGQPYIKTKTRHFTEDLAAIEAAYPKYIDEYNDALPDVEQILAEFERNPSAPNAGKIAKDEIWRIDRAFGTNYAKLWNFNEDYWMQGDLPLNRATTHGHPIWRHPASNRAEHAGHTRQHYEVYGIRPSPPGRKQQRWERMGATQRRNIEAGVRYYSQPPQRLPIDEHRWPESQYKE